MNNTKWREFFLIVANQPVYVQLQRIGDLDFHIDYEQSNWVLSNISTKSVVYICKELEYKSILAIRICKSVIPPEGNEHIIIKAIQQIKNLGKISSSEDEEYFVIHGYQKT